MGTVLIIHRNISGFAMGSKPQDRRLAVGAQPARDLPISSSGESYEHVAVLFRSTRLVQVATDREVYSKSPSSRASPFEVLHSINSQVYVFTLGEVSFLGRQTLPKHHDQGETTTFAIYLAGLSDARKRFHSLCIPRRSINPVRP
jgi:hypothetical protein